VKKCFLVEVNVEQGVLVTLLSMWSRDLSGTTGLWHSSASLGAINAMGMIVLQKTACLTSL
jgi:hypothetical protein